MKNENITETIKKILVCSEECRNNDKVLYLNVIETLSTGISLKPFNEVMLTLDELGLPCYDTVTRLRRYNSSCGLIRFSCMLQCPYIVLVKNQGFIDG